MHTRLLWASALLLLVSTNTHAAESGIPYNSKGACACDLYLSDGMTKAFTTNHTYVVDCADLMLAHQECRDICSNEVRNLNAQYVQYQELFDSKVPKLDACPQSPEPIFVFYKFCSNPELYQSPEPFSKSICCDQNSNFIWCDYYPGVDNRVNRVLDLDQIDPLQSRKLDTQKDKHDIENNEIEGSTKNVNKPQEVEESDDSASSWITYITKLLGFSDFSDLNLSDLMSRIDIRTLPEQLQTAYQNYQDEVGMGQCYMELTTYTWFSKPEITGEQFIRRRRDADPNYRHPYAVPFDANSARNSPTSRQEQAQTIRSVAETVVSFLRQSESTRQYADAITKLLPSVLKLYTSNDPQGALSTIFSQVVTPFLVQQMQQKPVVQPIHNAIDKNDAPSRWPAYSQRPAPPQQQTSGDSSPFSKLAMGLVKNMISSYMSGGSSTQKIERPQPQPIIRTTPAPRPQQTQSSGIWSLLSLLGGGSKKPAPVKKIYKPEPVKKKPVVDIEQKKTRDFSDMVLGVIRPVFISIVGKTPGETGVEALREVIRLSSLSRIDDSIRETREEVLSPFFCAKNYMVNKAWTFTERGIRSLISSFSPQQRERMKKMLF